MDVPFRLGDGQCGDKNKFGKDVGMVNIFAGNLSYGATEEDLRSAFEKFGTVERVSVIMDRLTGRSRGFGFVEMPDADQARAAIEGLHDQEMKGRKMLVREAEPRPRRQSGDAGSRSRHESTAPPPAE